MLKKYWWVAGIAIIGFVYMVWPRAQKKTEVVEQKPVNVVRFDQYLPVDLAKAKSVNWQISDNIELPQITKIKIRRQAISPETELKIKEILGINDSNGYFDKENNIASFTEEIKSIKQLPTNGNFNVDDLKNKLKKIVESVNRISNIDIEWTSVEYQKILYPRWMESTEKEAQSIEIKGDYVVNGKRITTYYGESIDGIFNRSGKLIKITLALKPEILSEEGMEQLINIDEASKSPISLYGVTNNAGVEAIDKVNITQAKIIEIYSNKLNIIKPYYWLDGNTFADKAPVKVSLIVKAEI